MNQGYEIKEIENQPRLKEFTLNVHVNVNVSTDTTA